MPTYTAVPASFYKMAINNISLALVALGVVCVCVYIYIYLGRSRLCICISRIVVFMLGVLLPSG